MSLLPAIAVTSTWHVHWKHSSREQKAAAGPHWQPPALWCFNTSVHHTWAATEQDSDSRLEYWQQDKYRGNGRWSSWIAWDWRRTWCNYYIRIFFKYNSARSSFIISVFSSLTIYLLTYFMGWCDASLLIMMSVSINSYYAIFPFSSSLPLWW